MLTFAPRAAGRLVAYTSGVTIVSASRRDPAVPVIELGLPSHGAHLPSSALALRDAATHVGLFYVRDHGVPASLIASHFAQARAFFAQPMEAKREIDVSYSTCFRGYTGFRTQTIDLAAPGDCKEGFVMGPDLPPDHPHVRARYPNTGQNLWPRHPAGFRPHMEAWIDAMNGLGRRLAELLAVSLELPAAYFADALCAPLTYSQLLQYPSLAGGGADARLGAGAHVDWGMLTLLMQDDVGGLERRSDDGRWLAVPPVAGTFVVILGEMMLRLTNGRYRSAPHRVAKNVSGRARLSMPTFFDPPYDYEIACVPTCRPAQGSPRYPAMSVAEHMLEMARKPLSAA